MAASNELLAGPVTVAKNTSSANATSTVTITAPSNRGLCLYLNAIIISASAAPAAAVQATIAGPSVTIPIEIPAAAFAPIAMGFGTHPIRIPPGTDLVVSVPALGSTVICSVVVLYQVGGF